MSTSTKQIVVNPTDIQKKMNVVYQLQLSGNSGFFQRKGKSKKVTDKQLHSSQFCFLCLTSKCWDEKTESYQEIAYVRNAQTIFMDDREYMEDGVKVFKKGLRSIYGERLREVMRATASKPIFFHGGLLALYKYVSEPLLLEYITRHDGNVDAPHSENLRAGGRTQFTSFKKITKEVDAQKRTKNVDRDFEGYQYAMNLRTKTSDGSYSFNEAQLDAVLIMLGEKTALKPGEVNQKWEIIIEHAKKNGEGVIDTIDAITDITKLTIGKAMKYQILTITKEARIDKHVVYPFGESKKDEAAKIDELILWFIGTTQGQQAYGNMRQLIDDATVIAAAQNKN